MKTTACVMAFLFIALTAQAALVDDFESYTAGSVTSPWVITDGTPTFGEETAGNMYMQSYGSYLALGSYSILNSDTETTVFFRVYDLGGTNPDVSAGLCNTATPGSVWTDYEAYVVLVGGNLAARNGSGNTVIVSGNIEATWYNIWLVINNSANTYDVYVTTGLSDATSGDLKGDDYSFRNGGSSDLLSFKVYGRNYAPIRVDDINITSGTDLSIPDSVPVYLGIISSPEDTTVSEAQNATFETVFTSPSTPTVQWFKEDSGGDIELTTSDSDISMDVAYDSGTEYYTATLTISNIAAEDAGFYYCRITDQSSSTCDSDSAELTVLGPVAHWTLDADDFSGGLYLDSVGGYDASAEGTPTFVTGVDGTANGAVQIDEDNGWATVEEFNPGAVSALSVSVWVNWQETSLSSDDLTVTTDPQAESVILEDGMQYNVWRHLCAVFNGTTCSIYINGIFQVQGSCSLPEDMTSLLDIGSSGSGSETFNGYMDDLRIYNYALTGTEVEGIYNAMVSVDTTPPAAPTNLTAAAQGGAIVLNWDDNSEADLDSYSVKRSTASGSGYTVIATDVSSSDYIDNSAARGMIYYYVVAAVDTSDNESDNSNEQSAPEYAGDLTLDGRVDMLDLSELSNGWQSSYDMDNLLAIADDWLN